jgi:predicted ester cyclase
MSASPVPPAADADRALVDAYNARDLETIRALLDENIRMERPDELAVGVEQVLTMLEGDFVAFPDLAMTRELTLAQGATVFSEYRLAGTHTGTLVLPDGTEIGATGRRMSVRGSSVDEWVDGRLVASRHYWDNLVVYTQLGLIPEPAT